MPRASGVRYLSSRLVNLVRVGGHSASRSSSPIWRLAIPSSHARIDPNTALYAKLKHAMVSTAPSSSSTSTTCGVRRRVISASPKASAVVVAILARSIPVPLEIGGLARRAPCCSASHRARRRPSATIGGPTTSPCRGARALRYPQLRLAPTLLSHDIALYANHLRRCRSPVGHTIAPRPARHRVHARRRYLGHTVQRETASSRSSARTTSQAHAKGLPLRAVRNRHVLRNALIPIVTYVGPATAFLVSGSFVIEYIFAIPGIGDLAVQSLYQRDYPVVEAITLALAFAVVVMNLLTDISYTFLDPRVRYE